MNKLVRYASIATLALSISVFAAEVRMLFPQPLHLTREIEDPIAGTTLTVEEYCYANRIVSIHGHRTVITDYEKQETTTIDRAANTYSVARFDELASVNRESNGVASQAAVTTDGNAERWKSTPLGLKASPSGRSLERFELEQIDANAENGTRIDVGVDRRVPLSREAVEVLIGAAYPNARSEEHEPLLRAAGAGSRSGGGRTATTNAAPDTTTYGLPSTQSITYFESGIAMTFRSTVTRVGSEPAPADALIIPPGAKRVESRAAETRRLLRELDEAPVRTPQP